MAQRARHAAGKRDWPQQPPQIDSTDRPRGSRRSRRCGYPSLPGIRPGSARRARWSGRKCTSARRFGAPARLPVSGRHRGSACSVPQCIARLQPVRPAPAPARSGSRRGTASSHARGSTRLVCLPCQPIPAACASGFSITGAVSTNTFSSLGDLIDDEAGERLQRLLDRLVIVAALRIDRDARPFRLVS